MFVECGSGIIVLCDSVMVGSSSLGGACHSKCWLQRGGGGRTGCMMPCVEGSVVQCEVYPKNGQNMCCLMFYLRLLKEWDCSGHCHRSLVQSR